MKIAWLDLKTVVATTAYYIAIVALVALLSVIVFKLMFWPPCTINAQHECVVDGWSVAGLAGTVLGVGATLLAILGAVAVAAWWTGLNKQVDARVNEQVQGRVNEMLEEQEHKLAEKTTLLLQEQKKVFEDTLAKVRKEMEALKEQAYLNDTRYQNVQKTLLIGVMQQDPWDLENWASEVMLLDSTSEVGWRMMLKYLKIFDGFFSKDQKDVAKHMERLEKTSRLDAKNPLGYFMAAIRWGKLLSKHPAYGEAAKHEIEKREPQLESWAATHGQLTISNEDISPQQ